MHTMPDELACMREDAPRFEDEGRQAVLELGVLVN